MHRAGPDLRVGVIRIAEIVSLVSSLARFRRIVRAGAAKEQSAKCE
ncbi:MAG: hypothetical protein JKY56_14645 [Kofleriaceae bacterium]|nr:hypothetical protein [Kofleriaceae bacterium]